MTHLLREVNIWLGVAAFFGLCIRTRHAWAAVVSRPLFLALWLFPIGVTFGSVYALQHNFPPSPTAPYFSLAFALLLIVLVWWPAPLNGDKP